MAAELTSLADAYSLERVRKAPSGTVDFTAQVAAYEERQREHPDRRHWSPTDQNDPGDDGPAQVLDGDLDRWKRLTHGPNRGKWRMQGFNPGEHEQSTGDDLPWQQLAYNHAPLTEATNED
ncbi:hypothetical protein [Streptomyces sp. NPDC055140]